MYYELSLYPNWMKCERPKKVGNVSYPCGKCRYCRVANGCAKARKYAREQDTRKYYSLFVRLSYSDSFLPCCRYDLQNEMLYTSNPNAPYRICDTYDRYFKLRLDRQYQINEYGKKYLTRIKKPLPQLLPILFYQDVQVFLDSLRHKIRRCNHLGNNERQFRYHVCGEYGPTYGRPHYHVTLLCSSANQRDTIRGYINTLWKYGYTNIQNSDSGTAAYVGTYSSATVYDLPEYMQLLRPPFTRSSTKFGSSDFCIPSNEIEFYYTFSIEKLIPTFDTPVCAANAIQRVSTEDYYRIYGIPRAVRTWTYDQLLSLYKFIHNEYRYYTNHIATRTHQYISEYVHYLISYARLPDTLLSYCNLEKDYRIKLQLGTLLIDNKFKVETIFSKIYTIVLWLFKLNKYLCQYKISLYTYQNLHLQNLNNIDYYALKESLTNLEHYTHTCKICNPHNPEALNEVINTFYQRSAYDQPPEVKNQIFEHYNKIVKKSKLNETIIKEL